MTNNVVVKSRGWRTEVLALGAVVLQLLGVFGVIDAAQATEASQVLMPAAVATLAARVSSQ